MSLCPDQPREAVPVTGTALIASQDFLRFPGNLSVCSQNGAFSLSSALPRWPRHRHSRLFPRASPFPRAGSPGRSMPGARGGRGRLGGGAGRAGAGWGGAPAGGRQGPGPGPGPVVAAGGGRGAPSRGSAAASPAPGAAAVMSGHGPPAPLPPPRKVGGRRGDANAGERAEVPLR